MRLCVDHVSVPCLIASHIWLLSVGLRCLFKSGVLNSLIATYCTIQVPCLQSKCAPTSGATVHKLSLCDSHSPSITSINASRSSNAGYAFWCLTSHHHVQGLLMNMRSITLSLYQVRLLLFVGKVHTREVARTAWLQLVVDMRKNGREGHTNRAEPDYVCKGALQNVLEFTFQALQSSWMLWQQCPRGEEIARKLTRGQRGRRLAHRDKRRNGREMIRTNLDVPDYQGNGALNKILELVFR